MTSIPDMRQPMPADWVGGENPVAIAIQLGVDQTVRGHPDGTGESRKILILTLPGAAIIACQMRILCKARIGIGRQKLARGIDIDALANGLVHSGIYPTVNEARQYRSIPVLCISRHPQSVGCPAENHHFFVVAVDT